MPHALNAPRVIACAHVGFKLPVTQLVLSKSGLDVYIFEMYSQYPSRAFQFGTQIY